MKCRTTHRISFLVLVFVLAASRAHAAAALLLEEPFGHFGSLTATGHAAVYLPRICASSPVTLRHCAPGESGVVISRYNAIAGYDWIAIPLIPYLYAVEGSDNVPLFANTKLVAFLRNQYRRKYLQTVAPDSPNGEPPEGNWTQLVGAAYDRTLYSYEIETTGERDDALIRWLNQRQNHSHFRLLSRNCADFARGIMNFYYPRTLHRSIVADLGVTTPKQLARTLVRYSERHPNLEFSSFVIPQVPGTVPRSTHVYGVLESFLKSKKYLVPLAVLHPVITGGIALAYLGTGRFDPAKEALIFDPESDSPGELKPRISSVQRRTYEEQLHLLLARWSTPHDSLGLENPNGEESWTHLQARAEPGLDSSGHPVLEVQLGTRLVNVGVSRENILSSPAPPLLAQQILTLRLREELSHGGASKTSVNNVVNDWNLLKKTEKAPRSEDEESLAK